MSADFSTELKSLVVAQAVTQTQLSHLSGVVTDHISRDAQKADEETDEKLEAVRLMAECITTLADVKEIVKDLKTKEIPAICRKNDELEAKIEVHDWLVKAALGVTLIASLGAAWSGVSSCEMERGQSVRDRAEHISRIDR